MIHININQVYSSESFKILKKINEVSIESFWTNKKDLSALIIIDLMDNNNE